MRCCSGRALDESTLESKHRENQQASAELSSSSAPMREAYLPLWQPSVGRSPAGPDRPVARAGAARADTARRWWRRDKAGNQLRASKPVPRSVRPLDGNGCRSAVPPGLDVPLLTRTSPTPRLRPLPPPQLVARVGQADLNKSATRACRVSSRGGQPSPCSLGKPACPTPGAHGRQSKGRWQAEGGQGRESARARAR